jgi:hypothetical protein
MAEQAVSALELAMVANSSPTTVLRVRQGKNVEVATLADLAAALGYRVVIALERLQPQPTNG